MGHPARGERTPERGAPPGGRSAQRASWRGDLELARRIAAGDEAAFTALVERFHRSMLRVVRAWISDAALAEEVVQESWASVAGAIDRFEGRSSLRTWIFHILANQARSRATREARTVPFSALDSPDGGEPAVDPGRFDAAGAWLEPPADAGSPEREAAGAQLKARILDELEKLPPRQKVVVTLRDVEEWSSEEVCNVLGLSETNQRVLLHRGRSKLRAALEKALSGEPRP